METLRMSRWLYFCDPAMSAWPGLGLVGTGSFSMTASLLWMRKAIGLPIVGVGRFLTAEGVLAEGPTLVIGDTQTSPPETLEQIRSAGVPVVILDVPTTFDGL